MHAHIFYLDVCCFGLAFTLLLLFRDLREVLGVEYLLSLEGVPLVWRDADGVLTSREGVPLVCFSELLDWLRLRLGCRLGVEVCCGEPSTPKETFDRRRWGVDEEGPAGEGVSVNSFEPRRWGVAPDFDP